MLSHDHLRKHLSKPAMAAALLLFSSALYCHGQTTTTPKTAEDECKQIVLYRAVGALGTNDRGGFVIEARNRYPQWVDIQSEDHKDAIGRIENSFFTARNNRGCQALMLASAEPLIMRSLAYKLFFGQLKNLQQAGGNASSSGTTSLVSKNFTSQLISVASEYGGMTQSTSGQTTTISGSLSGIPLAVESKTGAPFLAECSARGSKCFPPNLVEGLSRFSFSVGVNSSGGSVGSGTASGGQGTTQPVTLSSSSSSSNYSLNQVTAKVAILRKLPKPSDLNTAIGKFDKKVLDNMDNQVSGLTTLLSAIYSSTDADIKNAITSAAEALLNGNASSPDSAWQEAARQLATAAKLAAGHNTIDSNYENSVASYLQAAAEISAQEDIAYTSSIKPTLSAEYDLNTPANQPTNSVFKLIGAWVPGNWTLTLNGAASIYNSQPASSIPAATRLRDVQLAAEADYKLSKSLPLVGQPTLSGAYYYQDQTSPSILKVPISGLPITGLSSTTNQVFTTKGPINIGQFKISLGKSNSGVKVPLSMTVSNRTELLTGMDVRGQIGISYDFSSLLSK